MLILGQDSAVLFGLVIHRWSQHVGYGLVHILSLGELSFYLWFLIPFILFLFNIFFQHVRSSIVLHSFRATEAFSAFDALQDMDFSLTVGTPVFLQSQNEVREAI